MRQRHAYTRTYAHMHTRACTCMLMHVHACAHFEVVVDAAVWATPNLEGPHRVLIKVRRRQENRHLPVSHQAQWQVLRGVK